MPCPNVTWVAQVTYVLFYVRTYVSILYKYLIKIKVWVRWVIRMIMAVFGPYYELNALNGVEVLTWPSTSAGYLRRPVNMAVV